MRASNGEYSAHRGTRNLGQFKLRIIYQRRVLRAHVSVSSVFFLFPGVFYNIPERIGKKKFLDGFGSTLPYHIPTILSLFLAASLKTQVDMGASHQN